MIAMLQAQTPVLTGTHVDVINSITEHIATEGIAGIDLEGRVRCGELHRYGHYVPALSNKC